MRAKHFIGTFIIVAVLTVFTPLHFSLAQVGVPADTEERLDTAIEEAIPQIEKAAEAATPRERGFINFILKILKGPFRLLKYLIGLFVIVDDPVKHTVYYGPQVFGVDCTGPNYKVIISDPPDEEPDDPRNNVVSAPLDPNRFKSVRVNGRESGCSWSGNFGVNEYAFCATSLPVTSREFVEVELIDSLGQVGSGISGGCFEGELPVF